MKIFFYLDVGEVIGFGHFFRCKVLADVCLDHGWEVTFIVPSNGFLKISLSIITRYHFELINDEEDIILSLGKGSKADRILFIDHYDVAKDFEKRMHPYFNLVLALDDIKREHSCDLLIDYYSGINKERLKLLNVSSGYVLAGPEFALIDPKYSHSTINLSPGKIKKILLYLGSCDPLLITKVLTALVAQEDEQNDREIVVLSSVFSTPAEVGPTLIKVIRFSEDLKDLYENFDFVIGAAGVSMFERMVQKVPGINFVCADNQLGTFDQLMDDDLHFFGGDLRFLSSDEVRQRLERTFGNYEKSGTKTCHCRIDGKGADRIFEKINELIKNESD